ncbi:MAG: hypothetical protein ABII23_05860 [bacterium]
MKKALKMLSVLGIMFYSSYNMHAADVPPYINYQGLLAQEGVPVNGPRNITFRLYDSADPTSILWEEIHDANTQQVQITDGVFNVVLGEITAIPPVLFKDSDNIHLKLIVEGEEFGGQKLSTVAYAFRSQSAQTIDENAVTTVEIASNTVTGEDIKNGSITSIDIAAGSITGGVGGNIGQGEVTAHNLSADAVPSAIPSGVIVMWSGSVLSIPDGWALCDGRYHPDYPNDEDRRLPNLTNKFIVAADDGDMYHVRDNGEGGGVNISSHTHSLASVEIGSGGIADHVIEGVGNHYHLTSFVCHGAGFYWVQDLENTYGSETVASVSGAVSFTSNAEVDLHSLAKTSEIGSHTHTITEATKSHSHNHPVSGSLDERGGHDNRPPYYALAFIMKL